MKFAELIEDDGTYVAARFCKESVRSLVDLQEQIGVPNPVSPHDLHTTIVYSRVPIEWEPMTHNVPAHVVGYRVFETDAGTDCLVLELDCPSLADRFNEAMDRGATFDFPSYIPHVTLSYDIGDFSHDALETPALRLNVAHEYIDDL